MDDATSPAPGPADDSPAGGGTTSSIAGGGGTGTSSGTAVAVDPAVATRHPSFLQLEAKRAADVQLRVADAITGFAGSMNFVYIHAVVFAAWMLLIEVDPWPKLTLVVSLEAIFLSTFVMIGQNRQAAFQQAKADHDFVEQELELKTNTEITHAIHQLTAELHRRLVEGPPAADAPTTSPG